MPERPRLVADTNTLVSRLLLSQSISAQAVRRAMDSFQLIVSNETLAELEEVLSRPKFDRYLPSSERLVFLYLLRRTALLIDHAPSISICRDPKDDKFLNLAEAGGAEIILSGDQDLLALHPFRGISILSPRQFLDHLASSAIH